MKKIHSRKRGLTLVEVLVSLAILGIIIIPFSSMILTATNFTSNSEQKVKATTLAQSIAEYIKNTDSSRLNFNDLSLVESTEDKEKFVRNNENSSYFTLYKITGEEYKNIKAKIKYSSIFNIDTLKSKDIYICIDSNNKLQAFSNGISINLGVDNYIDKTMGQIDISISISLGKVHVNISQGGKIFVNYSGTSNIGEINFNFATLDTIIANISASNETSSKVKLNCFKNSNTLAKYAIISGQNLQVNNGIYYKDSVLINKGDTIGIEIYSTTNGKNTLLQEINVVKTK